MPLDDFANKIAQLEAFDFGEEFTSIVGNNTDKLDDLLAQQLSTGRDGNGDPVKLYDKEVYQPSTIEHKKKYGKGLGAITDRITNYMSGDFYKSLETKIDGDAYQIDSDVAYYKYIIERSGEQIMELGEPVRKEFAEEIVLPEISEALKAKTGLVINQ